MKKNIYKNFIVLFGLGFILFGYNFVFAADDIIAPVIIIKGINPVELYIGDEYKEEGVIATDDVDGDITSFVITSDDIDINTAGSYTVTYNVSDISNNAALEEKRNIIVKVLPTPPVTLSVDTSVDVLSSCEVLDLDGVNHTYTSDSETAYLGICALKAALNLNSISELKLSNKYPSMGLFVTSLNNIEAQSSSQYWALYQNDLYTDFGISTLPISVGDIISFKLSDFAGNETGDSVIIRVNSLIPDAIIPPVVIGGGSSGGSSSNTEENIFSVENALNFLYQNKNSDGSFGSSMYTDWVAIAAKASNDSNLKSSILNYLKSNQFNSSIITDYERRAMAIMALGINPYNGTDINYINKITSSFDGIQIGDSYLWNDDIFGLIVLGNSGYTKNDEIIKSVVSFVIKNQSANGSWGSVDMTAAAIQSLSNFKNLSGVSESISKGELYLITEQKIDGSFGNSSSTSWAVQALSLNNSYNLNINKAIKYLATSQHNDGGIGSGDIINNRIWSTSYAIPAVLKLSWNNILDSFSKEEDIKPLINIDENKINVEILAVKEIEEIILEEEIIIPIKNEEIKVITDKLVKNKKEIISKIEKTLIENKKPVENLLSASVGTSVQNQNTFFYAINLILEKISSSFSWLFINLIF